MLNITDPAILFPGISLLFLAYTNRYLTIAGVIRELNDKVVVGNDVEKKPDPNRIRQIQNLGLRIQLIKYMQAVGVLAFLACILSMLALLAKYQQAGEILFVASLCFMFISLSISLIELLNSGHALRIELERTRQQK